MLLEYLELGKIVSTHGVRGELRVDAWCDSPEFFKSFKTIYLGKEKQEMTAKAARPHGNIMLLTLDGIDDLDKANALRGKILYVKRADAPLEDGSYFIAELIGCEVIDVDSKKVYGKVVDVLNTGASDIWQIKGLDGKEYLLPSIKGEVVIDVDVANDKAFVRPIKGIFDEGEEIRED